MREPGLHRCCMSRVFGRRRVGVRSYFIPCCRTEFLLVLQMIRSAHWTTTMLAKNAV